MNIWLVVTGTWLDYFFLFFHILGIIIPTDEVHHFSEGFLNMLKPPTRHRLDVNMGD